MTSQRAIELAVEKGGLRGAGRLTVRAVITAEGTNLLHVVEGEIDLGSDPTSTRPAPLPDR